MVITDQFALAIDYIRSLEVFQQDFRAIRVRYITLFNSGLSRSARLYLTTKEFQPSRSQTRPRRQAGIESAFQKSRWMREAQNQFILQPKAATVLPEPLL